MRKIAAALVVLGLLPLAGCAHRYSEPYYQPGPYSYYDAHPDRRYDGYGPPVPYYSQNAYYSRNDGPPEYGPDYGPGAYGPAYTGPAYSDQPSYGPSYGEDTRYSRSRYSSSYYDAPPLPAPYPPPPYNSPYYSTYYGCSCGR